MIYLPFKRPIWKVNSPSPCRTPKAGFTTGNGLQGWTQDSAEWLEVNINQSYASSIVNALHIFRLTCTNRYKSVLSLPFRNTFNMVDKPCRLGLRQRPKSQFIFIDQLFRCFLMDQKIILLENHVLGIKNILNTFFQRTFFLKRQLEKW